MGANLTSCAGGRRRHSSLALGDAPTAPTEGSHKPPPGRPPKPSQRPTQVQPRSRPEVVPVTDGELRAECAAASSGSSGGAEVMHCNLDPVPDVLPLEAAAQWAREKRQSRRQNSTPATPVSSTFTLPPASADGAWRTSVAETPESSFSPSDAGEGHSKSESSEESVRLRYWPSSTAAADEASAAVDDAASAAAAAEPPGGAASAAHRSNSAARAGEAAEPIVLLQPVPKRHKAEPGAGRAPAQLHSPAGDSGDGREVVSSAGVTWPAAAAATTGGGSGKPPALSRLLSMPLPPIPVQQHEQQQHRMRGLPPKPKHLSLGSNPLEALLGSFGSPVDSPPLPPPRCCRPSLLDSVDSGDWQSTETLTEAESPGRAHCDMLIPADDSGSDELATDSLSACPSNESGQDAAAGSPVAAASQDGDGWTKSCGTGGRRRGVTFAAAGSDGGREAGRPGGSGQSGPQSSPSPAKRPRKPPRTYSYKAASQPKRISRTTEEFEEIWDAMRRTLSMEQLAEDESTADGGGGSDEAKRDDAADDDDIYQNMYATRMRCWQVLTLAQDAFVDLVDPDAILDFLHEQRLLSDDDYDAIVNVTADRRERNDAVIDLLLERGDGYYDKCREFLRNSCASPSHAHSRVGRILDSLNDTFIIGSKANHWSFSLTTRQCSVAYDDYDDNDEDLPGRDEDGGVGGDEAVIAYRRRRRPEPSVRLDIYQENFGDRSCTAVADMLASYDVVSRLSLVKNGIGRAGAQRLAPGLVGRRALRELSLRLNPLRNDGLAALASLALSRSDCRLVELNLSHTGIGRGGAGTLLSAALGADGAAPCLRRLDVSHNELDDADCAELAVGLERHCGGGGGGLAELCMRDNAFGSAGCRSLCIALADGSAAAAAARLRQQEHPRRGRRVVAAARRLDISQNAVCDAGAVAVAESLLGCGCDDDDERGGLAELRVEKCGITAAGCAAIAGALGRDRRLETLFVSGNAVGNDGMSAFAVALAGNCTLRVLCADMCADVGDAGLAAVLGELATSNRSLVQFSARYLPAQAVAASKGSLPADHGAPEADGPDAKGEMVDQLAARARRALPGRKVSL